MEAVVKLTADRIVAEGKDVPDFGAFMKSMKPSITGVIPFIEAETDRGYRQTYVLTTKIISESFKINQGSWDTKNPKRIILRKLTCITCEADEEKLL